MRNVREKILGILNILLSLLGIAFIGMLIMLARDLSTMYETLNVTNMTNPYALFSMYLILISFTVFQLILGIILLFTSKANSKYTKLGIALIILWGIIFMILPIINSFLSITPIYTLTNNF